MIKIASFATIKSPSDNAYLFHLRGSNKALRLNIINSSRITAILERVNLGLMIWHASIYEGSLYLSILEYIVEVVHQRSSISIALLFPHYWTRVDAMN